MAIKEVSTAWSGEQQAYIKDYVCDGASDIASLPSLGPSCGAGSTAHYASGGALVVYELAPGGTWQLIAGEVGS